MDINLNPAVAQFQLWDTMLTAYNGDWHQKVTNNRFAYHSPLRHRPYLTTHTVLDGHVEDNLDERAIKVANTGWRQRSNNNYLFTITESGRFRITYPSDRSLLRFLEKQAFLGYYPIRGAVAVFVTPGMHQERRSWQDYSPRDIEKRYPYVPHTVLNSVWYRAEQDLQGRWRLGLYLEDNPLHVGAAEETLSRMADDLEKQYIRTERLYRNRRRRHFRSLGIKDPENMRFVVQHLDGDALAKAFPIYRPAPVNWPEPRPLLEASRG